MNRPAEAVKTSSSTAESTWSTESLENMLQLYLENAVFSLKNVREDTFYDVSPGLDRASLREIDLMFAGNTLQAATLLEVRRTNHLLETNNRLLEEIATQLAEQATPGETNSIS